MLRIPLDWEVYRRPHWVDGSLGDRSNGCFTFPKPGMVVVVSNGEGWEHVSISNKDRTPTWAEMDGIKRLLWGPDDVVVQYHPAIADHVNVHPFCLHLWRPIIQHMPMPPKGMV